MGDDGFPVVGFGLAEQAHGGVPGRISAFQEPTPVARVRDEGPDRFPESAGEVRDGGIHRDDEVHLRQVAGGVVEILEAIGQRHEVGSGADMQLVLGLDGDLEAEESDARCCENGRELGEGDGASDVIVIGGVTRPHQPDFERPVRKRGQGLDGWRGQPGIRGDGVDGCSQHQRQAHDRDVIIERRWWFAKRDDCVRAPGVLEQTFQRSAAFEDDAADTRAGRVDKPDELDDITEALFRTDEQGFVRDWLATPERLRAGSGRSLAPAPFVFAEAFLKPANGQEGEGVIAAGETKFGLEREGAFIGGEGFVGAVHDLKDAAEVVPEFVIVWVQRECLAIGGDGAVEIAQFMIRIAQTVPGIEIIRIPLQGGVKRFRGARRVVGSSMDAGEGVPGVGRLRGEFSGVAETFFRFRVAAGFVQDEAQEIGHFAIGRCTLEQLAADGFGLRVASLVVSGARGL